MVDGGETSQTSLMPAEVIQHGSGGNYYLGRNRRSGC